MPIPTDQSWRPSGLHDQQVQDMISKYESIKPSHALRYIVGSSKLYTLFCELIEHQIGIILSRRSQAIEDGLVTVYDKCLLELCCNGREVHRQAGQEFYIREFLGVDPDSAVQRDVEEMLDREVFARGVLVKSFRSSHPVSADEKSNLPALAAEGQGTSTDLEDEKSTLAAPPGENQDAPFSSTDLDTYGTTTTDFAKNATVNTNIKRMLHIYFEAKSDLYKIESSSPASFSEDYQRAANAAKFLRDSAENALDYLQSQDLIPSRCCDELMAELQTVFKYAKSKAIEFLGGRKRRFEVEKKSSSSRSYGSSSYSSSSNYSSIKRSSPPSPSLSPARKGSSFRSEDGFQDSPRSRKRYRRVAVDRYSGSGSRHQQHMWHPYAGREGSRARRSADRKSM